MAVYKASEWQGSSELWYCNDVSNLAGNSGHWIHQARIWQLSPAAFIQFLILEFAIDGLRLAALNTPSMLSTPLSVVAGIVLGDFTVSSGWFNAECMLYMAFVAIANYTQASYELSYALKFMRIISLILTAMFGLYGYIAGIIVLVLSLVFNKTISGDSYVFPLLPLKLKQLGLRFVRRRLKDSKK